ncbi:LuxR family two component transcriptional regulator [Azospirillum brasilense]|uniref:LuxR family two component transcriptional regulator n=1 Tax=Azospirillum brasilense TaxID=192 RepID=A0A560CL98_AZOBR|nr:response regulator transcription factor [Azospirillum brasilense]MBK3732158.1 DNA-binding response regulator [Azospirillum brasilense]TWA85611.1 LuxR family two component transcriptional regulator [Azospirillum brasilense]
MTTDIKHQAGIAPGIMPGIVPGIAVVLADPNSLTRDCFSLGLGTLCRDMTVRSVASLKDAAGALARDGRAEVVLCNIGAQAGLNDVLCAAIRDAVSACLPVPLVIISDRDDGGMILESLRLGVRGYIVPSLGLGVMLEAIRLVAAGGTFVPATSLQSLIAPAPGTITVPPPGPGADLPVTDRIGGLTPREMAVLTCMREGKSNKLIAYMLGMCENTAKAHVRNVLKKLGATNRTEAAFMAHAHLSRGAPLESNRP